MFYRPFIQIGFTNTSAANYTGALSPVMHLLLYNCHNGVPSASGLIQLPQVNCVADANQSLAQLRKKLLSTVPVIDGTSLAIVLDSEATREQFVLLAMQCPAVVRRTVFIWPLCCCLCNHCCGVMLVWSRCAVVVLQRRKHR